MPHIFPALFATLVIFEKPRAGANRKSHLRVQIVNQCLGVGVGFVFAGVLGQHGGYRCFFDRLRASCVPVNEFLQ
ncbi:MAG: hypothetical protein AAF352_04675 [Pseudomonadota bacterium]